MEATSRKLAKNVISFISGAPEKKRDDSYEEFTRLAVTRLARSSLTYLKIDLTS